jgi:hypothetical protein
MGRRVWNSPGFKQDERQALIAPSATPEHETLYHRAFAEYRLRALWNLREIEEPTAAEALTVTRSLLVEELELACRARVMLRGERHPTFFHDREERVAQAALSDASVLEAGGFRVS